MTAIRLGGSTLSERDRRALPLPNILSRDAWLALAAILVSIMPLLWPDTPPLTDLPNHMSRYRIALEPGLFTKWFEFHWALVGNLGVDLLVMPFAWAFGIEPAVKIAMMIVIAANVGGMLLIAREVHGRIPATTFFALPFAYSYAFNFGFVNFVFAMGLALLAFGLWLRMGRLEQVRLRAIVFVPVATCVWLAHVCGWVALGMLVFASETVARRDRGRGWIAAAWSAGLACLPLALPALGMLHWLGGTPAARSAQEMPEGWHKFFYLILSLRNGDPRIDTGSVALVFGVLVIALRDRDIGFDRRMVGCLALLGLAYAIMPGTLMGAYYADMRFAAYLPILALLAIRPDPAARVARWVGLLAIAFFAARMNATGLHYAKLDSGYRAQLAALDHMPRGARVFASVRTVCMWEWDDPRMTHLGRFTIIRRDGFVNGTWPPPGAQMLFTRPGVTPGFVDQDSELIKPLDCREDRRFSIDGALDALPRRSFDYYWVIGMPPADWPKRDWLRPVWHNDSGILYKIARPAA